MNFKSLLTIAAAVSSAAFFSSCSNAPSGGGRGLAAYHAYDRPTKLPSNPANVRVKVSLSKQRTYVMEGSEVLLAMPVSVGAPGTVHPDRQLHHLQQGGETPREHPRLRLQRRQDQARRCSASRPAGWSFKGTPMPYWCEFKPNYGFHTGWVKHHPCTHGCIRMHENLAPKFFRLVKVGTPVSIAYSQPEDATHGNIPLPPDSGPLPDYPGTMYIGDGYFNQHKTPKYD